MTESLRTRIAGSALFAVALVWIVLVYQTIEPSQGTTAGARAFPLFFGIVLAGLSLALLIQGFRPSAADETEFSVAPPKEAPAAIATVGAIVVYGFLLEPLGFIPTTALVVTALMILVLRTRSPLMIASMAIGLSLGCYLVFGKLLGTYLPPGTLITIYL